MAYTDILLGSDNRTRLISAVVLVVLYVFTVCIYNAFFHPLAKFPGPFLWRASRLPYLRAVWGGHFPYDVQKLHETYGEVVRTSPNELSFSSPSAWDDIYSNRDGANPEAFRKSELWHGNPGGGAASVFVTINPKDHSRIRRFMDPAFSERAVLQQGPILQHYVDLCIDKLRGRSSADGKTTVNVVDWFNFILFDIIGDLSFGESFGCLDRCEYEDWMAQMSGAIKLNYLSINIQHFPKILALLFAPFMYFLIPKGLIAQMKDYEKRSKAKLDRRLSSTTDRPDIVSQLLKSKDKLQGMTEEEVVLNCMLFINAASETSSTVLTGVVNNLLQHPASLRKLEQEVRNFSSSSDLTLQALKQLPYLNATLKEALRVCNPIPIGNMRISPPQGGMVSGSYVPGNTYVTIQQLALSFSSEHFHEPHAWRPDRWLDDAETNSKSPYYNDNRKAIRAFGWGQHNCVGEPLGWAWMRLILAKFIWTFDLKEADSQYSKLAWDKQDVFATVIKERLDVTLSERST